MVSRNLVNDHLSPRVVPVVLEVRDEVLQEAGRLAQSPEVRVREILELPHRKIAWKSVDQLSDHRVHLFFLRHVLASLIGSPIFPD